MNPGIVYWLLVLIWMAVWIWSRFPLGPKSKPSTGEAVPFLLLIIIGWKVFGWPFGG